MQKVHFISGLGANKRAFSFLDISFCTPVHVEWITPLPNESLQAYALRLRATIDEPNPTIVGLSFGGMLATEMAKADASCKVILVASNKTHKEFPFYLKIGKYLPLYKYLPNKSMSKSSRFFGLLLGAKGKEQRATQKLILQESNPVFTKWAISAIMKWQNKIVPKNIIHIHGTADKLLPLYFVQADYFIKGGEHLMVMDKPEEISALLKKLIVV